MVNIRDITVVEGRFFTDQEEGARTPVVVIGDEIKTTLFPAGGSPLNQLVRINGVEFHVVGVQERLGSAFGRSQDKSAWIPVTVFNRLYGPGQGFALFGRPKPGSGYTLESALDETRVAPALTLQGAPRPAR